MPIIPNLYYREALSYGTAVLRGLVDPSAPGSFLKPLCTPGIVDLHSLFEFNAGRQNNGGRASHPPAAAGTAARHLTRTQPGGNSPPARGGTYELPAPSADHAPLADADYAQAAQELGIADVAVIKAVAQVESGGHSFLHDGRPVVRYEPHHFRKFTHGRFDKDFPALSAPYSVVKKQHLSKGNAAGYLALEQAIKLDSDAAVQACSWGAFQVMGDCWQAAGFADPHNMLVQVFAGLSGHLRLFVGFIKKNNLASPLQNRDWATFARRYNGGDYAVNRYDEKLQESYLRFARQPA